MPQSVKTPVVKGPKMYFIAVESQKTLQAPITNALPVDSVIPGVVYSAFCVFELKGITWAGLYPAPNKNTLIPNLEWVKVEEHGSGPDGVLGFVISDDPDSPVFQTT